MKRRLKKSIALLCILSLVFSVGIKPEGRVRAEEKTESIFEGDNFEVEFRVDGRWKDGYNANITIRNNGKKTIEDWALLYYTEDKIQNLWNGKQIENEYSLTMIKNAEWNQDIKPGQEVSFGFTAAYEDEIHMPKSYSLSTCRVEVPQEDYEVAYQTNSDWKSGYSSGMAIRNLTEETIEDWDLQFDFGHEIDSIWNASISKKEEKTYYISNSGYNQNISPKSETCIGFNGTPGDVEKKPDNFVLHKYTTEIDPELDSDGDKIPNIYELKLGTNSYRKDTDGDGLDDFVEVYKLGLDPLKKDTDGNGILDGDEDSDEDGLTNRKEIASGTEPGYEDTDGDGISDGEEVNRYRSDPLKEDTDEDSLTDGDDVALGFSPLKKDTDENGVTDDKEKIQQSITKAIDETNDNGGAVTGVRVDMRVTGNIANNTEIENVFGDDILSSELVGLVGVPVEVTTTGEFEEATITFFYDVSKLGDTSEDDLAVMWYDEANDDYVIFDEESVIDKQNHTVSYTTTHFSKYMVVNKKTWYNVWRNEINYHKKENPKQYTDIVFTIDTSGSMVGPEIKQAKDAMKGIVRAKRGKDRCNIVTFTGTADLLIDFTNSTEKLNNKINSITPKMENKTNVDKGLTKAIKQYTKDSYKDKGNQKFIVLICDGDMDYNKDIVNEAKKNDIAIITVLIGTESEAELKKMSRETGGKFYSVEKTDSIADVLFELQKDTLGKIDTTDTDGDGLYDVYEENGMLCQNGKIMKSSKDLKHTDSDGVNDFEEMGGARSISDGRIIHKKKLYLSGTDEWIEASYFKYRSNPQNKDTDGDGYRDGEDDHPRRNDVKLIEIGRKDYVPIREGSEVKYGGVQNWWENIDSVFLENGCGIIAGADVLLYVKRRKQNQYNIIEKDEYMKFVDGVRGRYINFIPFINEMTAVNISYGINKYCREHSLGMKAVSYPCAFARSNRGKLKQMIRQQISNGNPVIVSAGRKFPGSVAKDNQAKMYERDSNSLISFTLLEQRKMYNHYVAITGVLIDRQNNQLRYQVSSWGEQYFIDYGEICNYMDHYGTDWTSDAVFIYYS